MSTKMYLQCVVMFILGQAFQVFLIKIPALKKQAKISNSQFIWKDWWKADANLVFGTMSAGAMLIIGFDELTHWEPKILEYVKWFFAFVGMGGSNFLTSKYSKYMKYFDQVTDEKTNKADGKDQ